ncbi:hypothetical protein [Sphingosinicella humi]|uniref:Uncharacterized protein n=1 Tax=Allosphingosinicella humi TaxID=2068657 RepID=A0A2U2J5E6_9SPHN|nr:hypothetical protein [Sphingosinicella humi]PWG03522.1 hypothetical protein DF286_12045 [Sphingosinicella humi]
MPMWTPIPLDYEPWTKGTDVFVRSSTTFDASSLGKSTPARDTARQKHFEEVVRRIAWHLGSDTVPVFIDFNGDRRRMDKGCMGHAVAGGFLEPVSNGESGYITQVTLKSGVIDAGKGGSVRREN